MPCSTPQPGCMRQTLPRGPSGRRQQGGRPEECAGPSSIPRALARARGQARREAAIRPTREQSRTDRSRPERPRDRRVQTIDCLRPASISQFPIGLAKCRTPTPTAERTIDRSESSIRMYVIIGTGPKAQERNAQFCRKRRRSAASSRKAGTESRSMSTRSHQVPGRSRIPITLSVKKRVAGSGAVTDRLICLVSRLPTQVLQADA